MVGHEAHTAEAAGGGLQMTPRLPGVAPPALTRFSPAWEECYPQPKEHHFKVEKPL